jgi:hypothetical protein
MNNFRFFSNVFPSFIIKISVGSDKTCNDHLTTIPSVYVMYYLQLKAYISIYDIPHVMGAQGSISYYFMVS